MALRDQPYLPLYVQDFMTDEKLNQCSASATGVYIRLMCLMHKSENYGKILLKQKHKQTSSKLSDFALYISKNMPFDKDTVEAALEELLDENVVEFEGDFLIQKRMVSDSDLSDKRSSSGKKGGSNTQEKIKHFFDEPDSFAQASAKANAKANAQASAKAKSEANAENEYEYEYDSNNNIIYNNNYTGQNRENLLEQNAKQKSEVPSLSYETIYAMEPKERSNYLKSVFENRLPYLDAYRCAWNLVAISHGLASIRSINPMTKGKILQKIKVSDFDFKTLLAKCVEKTKIDGCEVYVRPHLMGENDRGWKITFDWLFAGNKDHIPNYYNVLYNNAYVRGGVVIPTKEVTK